MESGLQTAKIVEFNPVTPTPCKNRDINKKRLINKINYINFQDGTLLVNFRHTRFDRTLTLQARPNPCLTGHLECAWVRPNNIGRILQSHTLEDILIPDQLTPWRITPALLSIDEKGIAFELPETGTQIGTRRVRRKSCNDIAVDLFQNSGRFHGQLADFTPVSFRVEITLTPPQNFYWINRDLPIQVHFHKNDTLLYAGECRIIKQSTSQTTRSLVLEPIYSAIPRYPNRKFRSTRLQLTPSPNIQFTHPITGQRIDLKVLNLSGTGFMVEEEEENATLLPGMIIPDLELSFAGIFRVPCKAQVVYRHLPGATSSSTPVRCGLAILDMAVKDHVMLLSLLNQTKDNNSYMCNRVDMEHLFNFFFETGFIYPEKYIHIQSNKKNFKDTYQTLYTKAPSLARHFIYQDNAGIQGHMSMLRFYENTWMAHHHAANHLGKVKNAGLQVLDQANNFINESHTLSSIHLNFILCYFRPDNRFPNKVFGGAAQYINDKKGCSLDSFGYLHAKQNGQNFFENNWRLTEASSEDVRELEIFYENNSGGLMIPALDLEPELLDQENLAKDYSELGLTRKRILLSLRHNETLKAFIMINISDACLNMSDLTNSIKVFIIEKTDITNGIFQTLLNNILERQETTEAPVLVYPKTYLLEEKINFEKTYNMFILNMQNLDAYFSFINKIKHRASERS